MKTIKNFVESIGTVNRYSLLNRLQSDCDYYLGFGNKCEKHLWGGDVKSHIYYMKILYLLLPINGKPHWLTMKGILNYQKEMQEKAI